MRFNWNAGFAKDPFNESGAYYGSQFLHKTSDKGKNWKTISTDLTTNNPEHQKPDYGGLTLDVSGAENYNTIIAIAPSFLDKDLIWVGTDDGNIQVTKDGGKTWVNVLSSIKGLPANTWCYHIEASVFSEGTAYAVFTGYTKGDYLPYVYKTTDFGQTWMSIITKDIPVFARSIQEDLKNPNLLSLGTELGLFITLDGGASWSKFENNFPSVAIHYMEMHPQKNDLVVATHGRGVIILDDISPLRAVTPEILTKTLHFFDSKPFVMSEKSSFGGTSSEVEFVGQNPSDAAQIKYFLSKRHTFGKMNMEILDSEGKLIATCQAGKQKGINTVEWYFNRQAPKVAMGKTLAFAAGFAPNVKAGKYTVKITKGNEVFTKEIEVLYDPKSTFTQSERIEQQRVTNDLFDMTQDLAYFVFVIDRWDDCVANYKSKVPGKNKVADDLDKALDALRDKLVVTKGDNYVGAGEPQLREKLGQIYSTIGSYYGAPTSSQLENIAMLKNSFAEAKAQFEKIKANNLKAFEKELVKKSINLPFIVPFEEFLKLE